MTKAEEHDIFDIPAELASGSLKYVEYIVVNGHPFVLVKDYKNSGAGSPLSYRVLPVKYLQQLGTMGCPKMLQAT